VGQFRVAESPLFDLFADHWPDFLRFETGVLTQYLASLTTDIGSDTALSTLLGQQGVGGAKQSIESKYVQPTLAVQLATFHLSDLPTLGNTLQWPVDLGDLKAVRATLRTWKDILAAATQWAPDELAETDYRTASDAAELLAQRVGARWNEAYRQLGQRTGIELQPQLRKRDVSLRLSLVGDEVLKLEKVTATIAQAKGRFKQAIKLAESFQPASNATCTQVLNSASFKEYCHCEDLWRALPAVIHRTEPKTSTSAASTLLDEVTTSLLISAPAGYGKTWFCKWHTLRDAQRLTENPSHIFPVYVRLYEHAHQPLHSFEEAFLPPALRKLDGPTVNTARRIRIYLDGLDEIPNYARQVHIAQLCKTAIERHPHWQIVITTRDYVRGPWLGWLPRLHLTQFTEEQASTLIDRWSTEKAEADSFRAQLAKSPNLEHLIRIPLLGTLMLALFRQVQALPATKTRLYRIFVELLTGGWDVVKQLHRGSQYGPAVKATVLSRFAMQLHHGRNRDATDYMFQTAVSSTLPSFVPEAQALLEEILQDGVLIRAGGSILFSHLSFQEYLAGKQLHADPSGTAAKSAIGWFLKGDDWWKEPVAFYIGSAENPTDMKAWLDRVAASTAAQHGINDFPQRRLFLYATLEESFEGYKV
jgi:hypothetical protein